MTKWNLHNLSDFQDSVTEQYATPSRRHSARHSVMRQNFVRIAVVVAATTALTLNSGFSNATNYQIDPRLGTAVTHGAEITQRSPLETVFSTRSGGHRMSPDVENTLLSRLGERRGAVTKKELLEQTIESIWFNQQEDLSSDAARLSKSEIEKIVRERKLT